MNKVIIIGRIGKDVELSEGLPLRARLIIATDERKKTETGFESATTWHNVVVFDKLAENVAKYMKKGYQICIEGRLQTSSFTDKNGEKRYRTEIIGTNAHFLDNKPREEKTPSSSLPVPKYFQGAGEAPSAKKATPDLFDFEFNDEDIPF